MNEVLLHLHLRLPADQLDHFRSTRLSEQLETLRSLGVWQPGDGADGGVEALEAAWKKWRRRHKRG